MKRFLHNIFFWDTPAKGAFFHATAALAMPWCISALLCFWLSFLMTREPSDVLVKIFGMWLVLIPFIAMPVVAGIEAIAVVVCLMRLFILRHKNRQEEKSHGWLEVWLGVMVALLWLAAIAVVIMQGVFNTEVLFQMLDNLFKGVNFLIWLVGLGTLLAGAIGVSNIMMVTVRERTTEIGIRRAIGATTKMILSQIISESIVLTLVAGMSGILFGVMILQMLEMGNTEDGIVQIHFQVGFWTAIFAALMVSAMGVLAGLAPAARAMSIKPVDAMRDE